MANMKTLIKQKKDKTAFKIQEYKQNSETKKWSPDTDVSVYELTEKSIVKDINDTSTKRYRTLKDSTLTEVKVKTTVNESTGKDEYQLTSKPNDSTKDNLNSLPTYE
jgi:Protein of unknown function (DUF3892)